MNVEGTSPAGTCKAIGVVVSDVQDGERASPGWLELLELRTRVGALDVYPISHLEGFFPSAFVKLGLLCVECLCLTLGEVLVNVCMHPKLLVEGMVRILPLVRGKDDALCHVRPTAVSHDEGRPVGGRLDSGIVGDDKTGYQTCPFILVLQQLAYVVQESAVVSFHLPVGLCMSDAAEAVVNP